MIAAGAWAITFAVALFGWFVGGLLGASIALAAIGFTLLLWGLYRAGAFDE